MTLLTAHIEKQECENNFVVGNAESEYRSKVRAKENIVDFLYRIKVSRVISFVALHA